jgi:hypothetical protein
MKAVINSKLAAKSRAMGSLIKQLADGVNTIGRLI